MTRDAPRTFRSRRLVRLSTQTRARMERAGGAGPKRGPVNACPRDVFAEWGGSKKNKPGGKILGGHRSRAPRTGCQPTRKGCCGTVGGRRGGSWCTPAENPCTCGKLWCTEKFPHSTRKTRNSQKCKSTEIQSPILGSALECETKIAGWLETPRAKSGCRPGGAP